jgi:hypothetical protein
MDHDIWIKLMQSIRRASRRIGCTLRKPRFSDSLIVAMYFWTVWHDRPLSWACDRTHYGRLFRPRKLPSVSQFCRRLKSPAVAAILQTVHDDLALVNDARLAAQSCTIDGKPLIVSPVSRDKQAQSGRICGGFAKGYKLHAAVSRDGRIVAWSVMPLNVAEQSVAAQLAQYLSRHSPWSCPTLVLADSNYDSAPLHQTLSQVGATLLTPLRGQKQVKRTKRHRRTLKDMGPARRAAVQAWSKNPDLCRYLLRQRDQIERNFSALCSWGGGLGPLPAWVRTLERVRRWVGVKIVLYHARWQLRNQLKSIAA